MPSTRSSSARQAQAATGSAVPAPLPSSSSTSGAHQDNNPDDTRTSGLRKRPTNTTTTTTTGAGATDVSTTRKAAGSTPLDSHSEKNLKAKKISQLGGSSDDHLMSFTQRNHWIVFAVASGACAAFNGVFAKLTTNDLTTTIAKAISSIFNFSAGQGYVELVVRVIFFSLNLIFNGVMWTLFTQALAKGNSTTQVSIMNTSTNFMITAILGFVIFSESLPPLWWLGAAMLVAGNVIIGRKDGEEEKEGQFADPVEGEYRDEEDEDVAATGSRGLFVDGDVESGGSTPQRKDDEDEDVPLIGDL